MVTNPMQAALGKLGEQIGGLKGDHLHAYEDLEWYSRWVMGYNNPEYRENSPFLKRIYEDLQYRTDDDMLILGPRDSAKSQAVTITWVSWMIGRNPLLRTLLAFASLETQGYPFSRQFDSIFTENQRFIEIFGLLKPENPVKWSESEKIVTRKEPPAGLKDATITIVGVGSSVPSKRADVIVCDDLVTQVNAYSPTLRKQLIRFVLQTLWPIVVPGGRRIIVGSRWDPDDLYQSMADLWRLQIPRPPPINFNNIIERTIG